MSLKCLTKGNQILLAKSFFCEKKIAFRWVLVSFVVRNIS